MRRARGVAVALAAVLAVPAGSAVAGCAGDPTSSPAPAAATTAATRAVDAGPTSTDGQPLAGRVIVLDPGHQLGNRNFPRQTQRPVPAGGFRKPCNTTGTSTNAGYPEATAVWHVTRMAQRRLEGLGARVILTRTSNSDREWGPCVDVRGRAGNRAHADLKVSVHADGSYARGAHGFHVIAPPDRQPWTHDVFRPSRRLAHDLRAALHGAGFPYATYTAGGDGYDVRSDLGTLNLSDVPVAMVELGNMRDAGDARLLTRSAGQHRYARALVAGIVADLSHSRPEDHP